MIKPYHIKRDTVLLQKRSDFFIKPREQHISIEEHKKELIESYSIKEMIYDFESGVAKDLTRIQTMIEEIHKENKELKAMIERMVNHETYSKTETVNRARHY